MSSGTSRPRKALRISARQNDKLARVSLFYTNHHHPSLTENPSRRPNVQPNGTHNPCQRLALPCSLMPLILQPHRSDRDPLESPAGDTLFPGSLKLRGMERFMLAGPSAQVQAARMATTLTCRPTNPEWMAYCNDTPVRDSRTRWNGNRCQRSIFPTATRTSRRHGQPGAGREVPVDLGEAA
jgi:hypothetical protein